MTTPSIEQTILLRPQSRVATIDDDGTIKSPSGQSVSTSGQPGGTGLTPEQDAKLSGLPDAAALAASLAGKVGTDKLGAPSGVAELDSTGKLKASQLPASALVDVSATGAALSAGVLSFTQDEGGPTITVDLNSFATDAEMTAGLSGKASTAQGDKADSALQPGALPLSTTVTAAQVSDAGAAGRELLKKATLPEIQTLVSEYLKPSRNLFDLNRVTDGFFLNEGGTWAAAAGFGVSDLIPIQPGTQYVGSDGVNGAAMRFTCYFAADGYTVVPGGSASSAVTTTAPAGAAYIRVTYTIGVTGVRPFGARTFQFEAGSAATAYVPHQSGVKPSANVYAGSTVEVASSVNLFDPADAVDGVYISNTGQISASPAFGTSGYIPVVPGMRYIASDAIGEATDLVSSGQVMRFVCYFDKDKAVVPGGAASSSFAISPVPAGVYFIRFAYNIVAATGQTTGKNSIQFQAGTVATKYTPFCYSFATASAHLPQSTNLPVWGAERLRRFQSWKRAKDYAYDLVLQGDSWTDGTYYAKPFKGVLDAKTLADGGPGYLAFSFANTALASQSIDATKLSCSWATGDWLDVVVGSWGLSGTHVQSKGIGKTLTITSTVALASLRIVYRNQTGQGGFSYSINGGAAVNVNNSAANSVGSVLIDTSAHLTGFTCVITSAAGVEFAGAVGRAAGSNKLTVHKAGMTGSRAHQFAKGALYPQALALVAPKGACFMWGTNEINANTPPQVMKAHIQRMVNYYRTADPMCDLVFMCPAEQTYGTEVVRQFVTQDYADAMYQLAQENHGAYINLSAVFGKFGQYQIDAGYMHADRVHPATRGGALIADVLAGAFGVSL